MDTKRLKGVITHLKWFSLSEQRPRSTLHGIVFEDIERGLMPPAARVTDMHVCPMVIPGTPPIPHVGGPILPTGSTNVIIGFMPAARVTDKAICTGGGIPDPIVKGSLSVMINNLPAARMGDTTAHGGSIVAGCPTVMIGDSMGGGGGAPGAPKPGSATASGDIKSLSPQASGEAMSAPQLQKQSLEAAAQSGAPFCEVCEKMKNGG